MEVAGRRQERKYFCTKSLGSGSNAKLKPKNTRVKLGACQAFICGPRELMHDSDNVMTVCMT